MPLTQTPSISLRDLALLAFAATFGWWAHSANTPVAAQRTPDQRADRADRDRSTPPDNSLAFQYGGLGPEGELTLYNAANHTLYVYPSIARNSNSHINCPLQRPRRPRRLPNRPRKLPHRFAFRPLTGPTTRPVQPPTPLPHPTSHMPNADTAPALSHTEKAERSFLLRIVQPGLAGLMDGSVSTLAPIFATAFATHNSHTVFLIGAAAAVGAGISMAFSEGLSDDGEFTGRGSPLVRGLVTGGTTFLGGFLHTLPFLIANVQIALIWAYAVVGVELLAIAFIRYHYFKTSFLISCLQVIVGGALVFAAGVLIGSS